ncbi:troponin T-like isoform X2 [Gigantopelta aegis]|uniref:troponin T-like isoform X2 n=1 Tax=Gigantopelta aegis TaxID=1735272 RepID=UPI001B88C8AA|nr:troponin T-like isoform X2 [Gigantopelta aegis]
MADEEQQPAEGEERPKHTETTHAPADENEAKKAMEEAKRKKLEKQQQELAEYEEMRREEREKEAEEIARLRERRLQRKKEREEEEKKLAELRAQEDARMKAEAEVRKRKKAEEEARLKAEKERKKLEAEERLSMAKKPNFVITKRSDSDKAPGSLDPLSAEDMQKSKEQLEEEKRAILSQRIQPIGIEGLASDKLLLRAKELNETIRRLVGDKYDLEQRFKRQQYDMIELAERARQMNKGKGKRGVSTVQVDESFDRLADKFTSAPPKIQLCSKYERHTDHRTYNERQTLFEALAVEPPPPEIQHVGGWEPPSNEPVDYGTDQPAQGEEQAA